MSGRLVLATDLDGTMAHGAESARREVVAAVRATPDARLIYVTGRTPGSARSLLGRSALPEPDILIADVGTSVLHGAGPARVREIEAEMDTVWPGADAVRDRLASVGALTAQEVDSPRRVAYWIEPVRVRRSTTPSQDPFAARPPDDASFDRESHDIALNVAGEAAAALEDLDVDVLVSANVFLDVLPRGVNKGSTLRRVLRWVGVEESDCVVAGDSLNDLALFETGLRGIVVGNCEPALLQRIATMEQVYQARGIGAEGVLEGLRHYGHAADTESEGDGHGE
ncbi:MAG TPA: HAD-IIB family hydrolase [Longimicrobiales bacterium]|nr:HAD-IIB family hydrolase [Longimicrobiales bacterium]